MSRTLAFVVGLAVGVLLGVTGTMPLWMAGASYWSVRDNPRPGSEQTDAAEWHR